MKIQEATIENVPFGGIELWNPAFRTIALDKIPESIAHKEQWQPYGYNNAILCRTTATVYLSR